MATGYRDSNLWLDVSDCVACAVARPHLFTEPAPHYLEDRWGFKCMLRLIMEIPVDWCVEVYPVRGTASRDQDTYIGPCAWSGLYYYCGGYRLFVRIPRGTSGLCALMRLGAPLILVGEMGVWLGKPGTAQPMSRRHVLRKRSTSLFDLSVGSPTYINCIGVPRGVPDD